MNDRKICFIMCVNDDMYEEECIRYIEALTLPEGYQIEMLSVRDAKSMTSGYNEAMHCSEAKYKIYLHQDVFIVYKGFLGELLKIFEDPDVGMIGMVGALELPEDAIMWHGKRIGRLYTSNVNQSGEGAVRTYISPYEEVEAVDGLLIATQYDIPWRDDIFKGWDFYDVSQSAEFQKQGYKVVVPYMENPWCIHDDGFLELTDYNYWRDVFLKEYRK